MNPVDEDRALDGEDDPALDPRRGREAMDPGTRNLAFIASGIGLLLVVVIGGWMLSARHPGMIPVIQAPAGPVRVKPVDPGGMQAMGAQAPPAVSGSGTETLAAQPEMPRPAALQAEIDAARHHAGEGSNDPQAAPVAPVPEPKPALPAPAPAPVPALAPAPDAGRRLHTDNRAASPGPAQARLAVQVAALESPAAAQAEWSRLCRSHPALFSGRTPDVEQADHDGRVVYRLRTGGFASSAEAAAFCEQARTQRVACAVADF